MAGRRKPKEARPAAKRVSGVDAVSPPGPRTFWLALCVVVALGAGLRAMCLFNDLWLDEIRTLQLIEGISGPWQILTVLRHDNNHPLNTLFVYLLGPGREDWMYRLLAWATGSAAVWIAGIVGRQQFLRLWPAATQRALMTAALATAGMVACSYLLIHYSSEARGYGPVVFFAVLAISALLHAGEPHSARWALVYNAAVVLGVLAHATMLQIVAAGVAWSLTQPIASRSRDGRTEGRPPTLSTSRIRHFALWHLPGLSFVAIYYFGFLARVAVGGGPVIAMVDVLRDVGGYAFGIPDAARAALALPLLILVTAWALILLWRRDRGLAIFYLAAVASGPLLAVTSSKFILLFPRYFIVSATAMLLLMGYLLSLMFTAGRATRIVALAIAALFVAGNAALTWRLIRDGRGQYRAALRYVLDRTTSSRATIASDNDFRNFTVMQYHLPSVAAGRIVEYYATDERRPDAAEWLFMHRLDETPPFSDAVGDRAGHAYRLQRVFPHAALSGWDWYVYRRVR